MRQQGLASPRCLVYSPPLRPRRAARSNLAERCQSGRSGRSRKPLWVQAHRGFESHPLRHTVPYGDKSLSLALDQPCQLCRQIPQPVVARRIAGAGAERLRKGFTALFLAVAPAPMDAGLGKAGIGDHLRGAVARQGLADIALGDVFLEPGEDRAEGGRRVAEQRRFGDAAGIERVEDDAGAGTEARCSSRLMIMQASFESL